MSLSFKIALATDCLAVLVALYFLIADSLKSYSSNNGTLLLATTLFCGWIISCYLVYQGGYKAFASVLAWIPAIPLLGYALMILLFVIFKPDMR